MTAEEFVYVVRSNVPLSLFVGVGQTPVLSPAGAFPLGLEPSKITGWSSLNPQSTMTAQRVDVQMARLAMGAGA